MLFLLSYFKSMRSSIYLALAIASLTVAGWYLSQTSSESFSAIQSRSIGTLERLEYGDLSPEQYQQVIEYEYMATEYETRAQQEEDVIKKELYERRAQRYREAMQEVQESDV